MLSCLYFIFRRRPNKHQSELAIFFTQTEDKILILMQFSKTYNLLNEIVSSIFTLDTTYQLKLRKFIIFINYFALFHNDNTCKKNYNLDI